MREYDIYLNRQTEHNIYLGTAREYEIYLMKRLRETSIIVQSLPYRDGISGMSLLALRAMSLYYTLQKTIMAFSCIKLNTEISSVLKTVVEQIRQKIAIQTDVELSSKKTLNADGDAIILRADIDNMLAQSFIKIEDALSIQVPKLECAMGSSLGGGDSQVEIDAKYSRDLKRAMEIFTGEVELWTDSPTTQKSVLEKADGAILFASGKVEMFYQSLIAAEAAFMLAAEIADMEVHYSLGEGKSITELCSQDIEMLAKNMMRVESYAAICADSLGTVISYFSANGDACIECKAESELKRRRKVSEVADLSTLDSGAMTLQDFFYVTIV